MPSSVQHSKKGREQSNKKRKTFLPFTTYLLRLLHWKNLADSDIDIDFITYFCGTKKFDINQKHDERSLQCLLRVYWHGGVIISLMSSPVKSKISEDDVSISHIIPLFDNNMIGKTLSCISIILRCPYSL